MPLAKMIAEYPGGSKPNTRRGRRYTAIQWLNWTMNAFGKYIKQKQYERALYWAITWGHHALIRELFQ